MPQSQAESGGGVGGGRGEGGVQLGRVSRGQVPAHITGSCGQAAQWVGGPGVLEIGCV